MNKHKTRMVALVLAIGLSGAAQAALQGRDLDGNLATFEAYYDTVLNITWLADANYAKTSGYDADGRMNWADANTWAANISFTDGVNVYDNWRLPTVSPINGSTFNYSLSYNGSTDVGYSISEQGTAYAGSIGSEMAHLFYSSLDNKGFCDSASSTANSCVNPEAWGLTNVGAFTNFQSYNYWSGTEYAPYTYGAWGFDFNAGTQHAPTKTKSLYALAVSPGDVGAVPEASAYAMMLAGLGLVGAAAKRRRG